MKVLIEGGADVNSQDKVIAYITLVLSACTCLKRGSGDFRGFPSLTGYINDSIIVMCSRILVSFSCMRYSL